MTERTGAGGTKTSLLRYIKLFAAIGLVFVAIPSSASAQATRTWVSGVGDDANPCSRTAPCKTFAGAISKTARGGIINCLDPGGFGALTITKSITLSCRYTHAGMLASGGINAININIVDAADTKKSVTLRGLSIEGHGTTLGLNGIRVTSANRVKVYDTHISTFSRNGFSFEPTNANAKAVLNDVTIDEVSGAGVMVAPPASGAGARVNVRKSTIASNGCGVAVTNKLLDHNYAQDCGTAAAVGGGASANVFDSAIVDNDLTNTGGPPPTNGSAGIFTNGPSSTIRILTNDIIGNTFGLRALDPGGSAGVISNGQNNIFGNNVNGTPNFTFPPTRK